MIASDPIKVRRVQKGTGKQVALLVGWTVDVRKKFMQEVVKYAKDGKLYQMSFREVTASEVQRNYMFLCLSLAADSFGWTESYARCYFENKMEQLAKLEDNDYHDAAVWLNEIIDLDTAEVKSKLKPMSDWKVGMMNQFIELIHAETQRHFPNFLFPDSKEYKGEILGAKHTLDEEGDCFEIEII